jgi:Lar family restriction alleviation protein
MRGLKKCPFCGSEAVLHSGKENQHNLYAPVYCAYIKCSSCTASVANFVSDCAEDHAIDAWNSRAEIAEEKITSPNSAR